MALSPDMPGHLIRRLHQHSTQLFGQRVQAAGSDLTSMQFAALDALRFHPGIDQAGLQRHIHFGVGDRRRGGICRGIGFCAGVRRSEKR